MRRIDIKPIVAGAGLALFGSAVLAQDTPPDSDQIRADLKALSQCQAETDDTLRLACYDSTVEKLQRLEPKTVNDILTRQERAKPSYEDLDGQVSPIVQWEISLRGRNVLALENGQVWEQIDSRRIKKPRSFDPGSLSATIENAAMGSFFMRIEGQTRPIRVRQVR